jgi:hypothetical protein
MKLFGLTRFIAWDLHVRLCEIPGQTEMLLSQWLIARRRSLSERMRMDGECRPQAPQ